VRVDTYTRLQDDIVGGHFAPGDSLVELMLAERYGVSRTPIREALKRLQAAGLVEQFARGYRVSRHTPESILDIYEVRIALEQAAAAAAAKRRTPFDLAKLRRAHQALTDGDSANAVEASRGAHAFHQAIWEAAHNGALLETLTNLQRRITAFSTTTLAVAGRGEEVTIEHGNILEAIETGDHELAGRIAAEHMLRSRDVRVEIYTQDSVRI
jgi:DNA-binding GntR family transcriptional regulator